GLYPDGTPGEIFVRMAKEGSTISGLMDSFALAVSLALQHGVPLALLCEKFQHTRFDPAGFTSNPDIPRVELLDPMQLPLTLPVDAKAPAQEAAPGSKVPVVTAGQGKLPWQQET